MEWACGIDWQALAGFANAIAIVVVALIAGSKFDDWKRQFRYRRRAETAERALLAVYEAEQALNQVRSPMAFAAERQQAVENIGTPNPSERLIQGRVIWDRIAANRDKWDAVVAEFSSVRFGFGEDAENALREVIRQVRIVQVAAEMYGDTDDQDFRRKLERDFWKINDEDEVSSNVAAARQNAEVIFSQYI